MLKAPGLLVVAMVIACAQAPAGWAQEAAHPGKAVYEQSCASCHDHPGVTRAPSFDALRAMRYGTIHFALTEGKMQAQGAPLSATERASLIDYLVGRSVTDDSWEAKMMCSPDRHAATGAPTVTSFGFDRHNHRDLSRQQAGLGTADFRHLELAWALGFPQATTMRAQAAVVGSTVFLPVSDFGHLYAIDVSRGQALLRVGVQERHSVAHRCRLRSAPGLGAQGAGLRRHRPSGPHDRCHHGTRRSGISPCGSHPSPTAPELPCCIAIASTCRCRHRRSILARTRTTSAARPTVRCLRWMPPRGGSSGRRTPCTMPSRSAIAAMAR